MRPQAALAVAVLATLLAAGPAAAALQPAADSPGSGAVHAHGVAAQDRDANRTAAIEIRVRASGHARWTVETYVRLDDEADEAAFRTMGRRFVNGTADVRFDADLFRRYAAAASEASGREMSVPESSVEREWGVDNGTGVLRLSFTWRSFARRTGSVVRVDDAFRTPSGTWLDGLEAGQTLVIRPPEGYTVLDAPTRVDNATLRLEGPRQFEPGYFEIAYRSEQPVRITPSVTPTPTDTSPPTDTPGPTNPAPTFVFGAGAVVVVGLLAYLVAQRGAPGGPGRSDVGGDDDAPGGDPPGAAADGATNGGASAAAEPGDEAAAEPEEAPEPTPEDPFAGVDVEMLSDEERVLRLLEANGGRMKQARIVKETDWSNAKVSQLLSAMADDEEVDKLRIGRENLISLPDVDVESFDS